MAIAGLGMGVQSLYQCTKESVKVVETKTYEKTGVARALVLTDALLGVTLIVLGVLALYSIVPMPEGWAPVYAFSAIAAGTVNLLASALKACQAAKVQYVLCKTPVTVVNAT